MLRVFGAIREEPMAWVLAQLELWWPTVNSLVTDDHFDPREAPRTRLTTTTVMRTMLRNQRPRKRRMIDAIEVR